MSEIRALVFDVDGVLVSGHRQKGGRWHTDMEADLGLDPAIFQQVFFTQHWSDIVLGRASIEERLAPVLREIAPDLSVETMLAYWFDMDSSLDGDLLARLAEIRNHLPFALHLATNQEHRRADYLWRKMELEHYFDAIHYSAKMGHQKPSADFYAAVEDRTGFDGSALLFFDDQEKNVAAARARGWNAHVWKDTRTLDAALAAEGF